LVGGCFDLIHQAHIEFLKKSKMLGDKLIVILECDLAVKVRKGPKRPVNSQAVRARILAQLQSVDYDIPIPFFADDTGYFDLVKTLKPDIIAITFGDPIKKIKEKQAKLAGGKVVEVMDRKVEYSTTKIIQNLSK